MLLAMTSAKALAAIFMCLFVGFVVTAARGRWLIKFSPRRMFRGRGVTFWRERVPLRLAQSGARPVLTAARGPACRICHKSLGLPADSVLGFVPIKDSAR